MKKRIFNLVVTETLQRNVEVEATSEEEALEELEKMYYDEEIVLDYQDLIDVEFSNCKYKKKEIQIMNEIHWFCKCNCSEGVNNCVEDECVLWRIEQIIENGFYEPKYCCICGKEICGYGNNAEPIKEGECCDKCNEEKVIPARLKEYGL